MTGALRWGDLPIIRDTESGIAAIEREQMTKPRPLDVEGPLLYQPPNDYSASGSSLFDAKDDVALDGMTLHTIQLLQYSHQVASLIEDAQHQLEQVRSGDLSSLNCPPPPPLPAWQPPKQENPMLKPFAFIPDNENSLFVRGISKATITHDETTCKQLLRRSVAAICAHAGFVSCNQSVLDTLTDVCQEYYRQMMTLLRAAVDGETYHGGTGFPDAITRVFYEIGIGSLSSIYDFYQSRVVGYHSRLLQRCINMCDEYEQLRKPRRSSTSDERSTSKAKEDSSSSSVIQFPTTEEADETGDVEQMDQLEGLGLDMSISQESSTTLEEENSSKWKTESGSSKLDHAGSEDRVYSSDSNLQGGQGDAFLLPSSQHQSESRRSSISGNVISPTGNFLLKPPLKKFKK